MTSRLARIACCALALGLAGCEAAKSSNPTSPTVAGPIPGVNITAPALVEPAQGFKFKESEQPIRLIVQNATSSGVRPLTYTFEVAADSSFTTKVFGRSGVAPGDGRTSVQIDRLEIGRAYYWRAWAEDGANTGATATAGFEIYPKPAVNAPVAFSPISNELVGSSTPTLKAHNATWVGPVGGLTYEFQVATDQSFSKLVAAGIINEGAGDTNFNSSPLSSATTHYWRVRATDGENSSAWSVTQGFRTPAAPAPSPSPSPTPGNPVPPGSCASNNGPFIANCIAARYPDRLRPVSSLGQRQANMEFLRDRMIEAGKCGGLDLGQNLKRGGPELSIDFLAWRRADGVMGVDVGIDYDNISTPLVLVWGEAGLGASYKAYPSVPCGAV